MKASIKQAYARNRANGLTAREAYYEATRDVGGPDVPCEHGEAFERDGFTLKLYLEPDDLTPRDIGMGRFTSEWEDGCIDRRKAGYRVERDQHPYYRPECTLAEYLAIGMLNCEAKRRLAWDHARAESFGESWWYLLVRVVACRNGVELGDAIIGGVESDCGDRHLRETIDELAGEAIKDAKSSLASLCSCS